MSRNMITILSIYAMDAKTQAQLERSHRNVRVIHAPTLSDMEPLIQDADVVLSLNFSDSLLSRAVNLRWFQAVGAGVNHLLTEDFARSGIVLTNARGNHAIPVSEHAFALLLALTRRINLSQGPGSIMDRWERVEGDALHGKTMGVLGVGNIGREIARKARAFGMIVRGLDEVPVFVPYLDRMHLTGEAEEFFSGLDVIVVAAALTSKTTGIVNRRSLSLMNRGSYLVNVSRGPVVIEGDLVDALRDGSLAGAGLDVFDEEPLPPDSPLRNLPNVVLTPHIAGFDPSYADRVIQLFVENFRRWVQGEALINVVNTTDVHWHDEGRQP